MIATIFGEFDGDIYGFVRSKIKPEWENNLKIAIIGSRAFPITCRHQVEYFVENLPEETTIVSGGASGVDTWAEVAAHKRGLQTVVFRPDYKKHPPKVAPLKRNETIIDNADQVVAFWDGASRGTIHACKYAKQRGKPITVYGSHGSSYTESEWCR